MEPENVSDSSIVLSVSGVVPGRTRIIPRNSERLLITRIRIILRCGGRSLITRIRIILRRGGRSLITRIRIILRCGGRSLIRLLRHTVNRRCIRLIKYRLVLKDIAADVKIISYAGYPY